jgi:hypothetical protein
MGKITRRLFLQSTPAIVTVAGAIVAPAVAEAATVTPQERFDAALAELKDAAQALDPRFYDWKIERTDDKTLDLLVCGWRRTTEYEGDGWYKTLVGESDHGKVLVERAAQFDRDGERWFRITIFRNGRRAVSVTPERHFTTEYGRRIS